MIKLNLGLNIARRTFYLYKIHRTRTQTLQDDLYKRQEEKEEEEE